MYVGLKVNGLLLGVVVSFSWSDCNGHAPSNMGQLLVCFTESTQDNIGIFKQQMLLVQAHHFVSRLSEAITERRVAFSNMGHPLKP